MVGMAARTRPTQLDFLRPSGPAPAGLACMLARLAVLCGPGRVGVLRHADSHRPDAVEVARFEGESSRRSSAVASDDDPVIRLALRALRPPIPLEVSERAGRIVYVRGSRFGGRVVRRAGPWRLRGDWWTADPYAREYYDVELSNGGMYRIYRDVRRRDWWADGSMTDAETYVELRCRSAFSFLAGASLPEDVVTQAARLQQDVVAIVDHDGVYGAPRAFRAAAMRGFAPWSEPTSRLLNAVWGYSWSIPMGIEISAASSREGSYGLPRATASSAGTIWRNTPRASSPWLQAGMATSWGTASGPKCFRGLDRLRSLFGPDRLYVEICRHLERRRGTDYAPHSSRWRSRLGFRWSPPMTCTMLVRKTVACSTSSRAFGSRRRSTPPVAARAKCRTASQERSGNVGVVPRRAGSGSQHAADRRSLYVHARESWLSISYDRAPAG